MAQVLSHYAATVGGNSCMYYYAEAKNTSDATRIYTGTAVTLPVDYEARLTNRLYPTIDPGGWIYAVYFRNITPVYVTVTDPCTPPSALVLDAQNKTLSISGGAGGDLNAWTGFGVCWRERRISSDAWGAWSTETVVQNRTVQVEVNSGMVRQFRVRTRGAAGSGYFSPYTVCGTLLNGNTAAGVPLVLLPVSGAVTCAPVPVIKVECPPDADGDAMTLERSMDGGAWQTAAELPGSGGVICDAVAAAQGTHTVRYRLVDANGDGGEADSVSFTRAARPWKRTIHPGDIIANREISFVADILEMQERINLILAFYGMNEMVLPGKPGVIADWAAQLSAMQNAVDECRVLTGRAAYGFAAASAWPHAQEINRLREAIETT